ncbi:hypothetical protein HKT18_03430 [Flavobacterium sp. IMCC34852]|uniref:Uncharacterized protein n=1 Tax=Flavobacterium rivulicola TaxID=2732161 RepID=A0A7Y3R7H6_9FLAO|nr:hypothetical protein [Flavobacterium sp. IMCC34852]NNT71261.1 hypothetical protein [Flavobacterium sp. IMCC34852]
MKKRLEAELISIAHRILKLKNKSEVDQLYKETQKLYETLTVLKFYQDNFESVKEDVEVAVLEEKLAQHSQVEEAKEMVFEVKPTEEPTVEETQSEVIVEEETSAAEDSNDSESEEQTVVSEEAEEEVEPVLDEEMEEEVVTETKIDEEEPVFKPIFELAEEEEDPSDSELAEQIEPAETASEVKPDTKHVALEDLLGENYVDPVFVKPNEVSLFATETKEETTEKPAALNTAFSKTIEIGLNDRVAFVNNLFGESNEDFNRVISQLNTFDTLEEAKNFLNEMVIPDYDYWVGKEDYIERFMAVVENKFK